MKVELYDGLVVIDGVPLAAEMLRTLANPDPARQYRMMRVTGEDGGSDYTQIVSVNGWNCKARASNTGGGDPSDCDWPVCGCDPLAEKVIEALAESGKLR